PPPLLLTASLAVATAVPDTARPLSGARPDRSTRPPSLVSAAATAWLSRCRSWARAAARAGVRWHVVNRSCSTYDLRPAAGVSPPHLCTTSSRAARRRRHAGGW